MQTWVRTSTGWKRPGLSDITSAEFVPGSVKPIGGTNVGAGIIGATPSVTITATTGVTISGQVVTVAAGTTVQDKVIPYFVNLGDGAKLLNCLITGPATEQATSRALVQGPSSGLAHVEWFTINPQTPSSYYDGVGAYNLDVRYGHIKNCTDGVRAYNTLGAPVNIACRALHVEKFAQFMPDVANSRTITHNDGCQHQGTSATVANDDVFFDGCRIDARRSAESGNATSSQPDNVAALMLTPNVGAIHLKFVNGWLSGGVATVNAGADALATGSRLEITNTKFEKPGTVSDSPSYALLIQSGLTTVFSGNTYEQDGTAVPVTNG